MKNSFTLIELLVVIAIISILSLVGYVSFTSFSADQVAVKAAGQIQSYLRLAQSNATTSTKCNNQTDAGWSLTFSGSNPVSIELWCSSNDPVSPILHYKQRTYTLDNAQITFVDPDGCALPVTLTYTVSTGALTLPCFAASSVTFQVSNISTPTAVSKTITVTTGGAINVQ